MNKQRFIERLNLFLDGELSQDESNELLEAVARDPELNRIYVQYCQIFKACSELGGRMEDPKTPIAWRQKLYAIGGMAAAFALLFMAVRNLAPLIDEQDGLAADGAEIALGASPASGQVVFANAELSPGPGSASFELNDKMLEAAGESPIQLSEPVFTLGSAAISDLSADFSSEAGTAWSAELSSDYSLDTPDVPSTFDHERLSAQRGEVPFFSLGSARDLPEWPSKAASVESDAEESVDALGPSR